MEFSQPYRCLSRDAILAIDNPRCRATLDRVTRDVIRRLQLCRRGCRSGERRRRKEAAASTVTSSACCAAEIPTILGNRRFVNNNNNVNQLCSRRRDEPTTVLKAVQRSPLMYLSDTAHPADRTVAASDRPRIAGNVIHRSPAPSLYLLNSAALSKPHAVDQLGADLRGYDVDVAVITETHFKSKHTDNVVSVPGYTVLRRDRDRRRGCGVALYVRSSRPPLSAWTFSGDDRTFELLCSCVNGTFIGSLYHSPRPAYTVESLLNYIKQCVVELNRDYPSSNIVLAGDFNLLPQSAVVERTGFDQLVQGCTTYGPRAACGPPRPRMWPASPAVE